MMGDRDVVPATNAIDAYENEIELMNYLKVLWKWKYLILVGTLGCAIAAAVVSFNIGLRVEVGHGYARRD